MIDTIFNGMDSMAVLMLLCLFVVAFLYASIGHGGASGYLAIMSLFGIAVLNMKMSVLLLDVLVAFISFYQFYKGGYFKWRLFWPFAVASVPAAFLGALMPVNAAFYEKLLGVCLVLSVVRIIGIPKLSGDNKKNPVLWGMLLTGTVIGFFSGILGIGGGILLSPVLIVLRWADMKETSAVSAAFIFVNAMAGLVGTGLRGAEIHGDMFWWIAVTFAGGLAGAYLGSFRFNYKVLRIILGVVLLSASYKLLL